MYMGLICLLMISDDEQATTLYKTILHDIARSASQCDSSWRGELRIGRVGSRARCGDLCAGDHAGPLAVGRCCGVENHAWVQVGSHASDAREHGW
jgi:L-asparaginase II